MNQKILVEQFCTLPEQEETDYDRKAFSRARILDITFENRVLRGYAMGKGQNVLLVHGWGSRASHLSLLARYLANNGFHVLIFDAPAHGNSRRTDTEDTSNMFEFGRAISCVAKKFGNIYGVIGHSIGATAASFAMAGTGLLSGYQFAAEKLILISAPESVSRVIENYCRNRNEPDTMAELTLGLEQAFHFQASDYSLSSALPCLKSKILIVHDEQDREIPVSDALKLQKTDESYTLILTRGYGHQKILVNRDMYRAVKEFLSTTD